MSEGPPASATTAAVTVEGLEVVLRERERQLSVAAQQNASLVEQVAKLQSELDQLRSIPVTADAKSLTEEFSRRISVMEKRFEAMKRERDAMARAQDDSALKKEITKAQEALSAKQRELEAIRAEGESLSKRQLAMETVLKRLRQEKKEDESNIAGLTSRLSAAEAQLSAKSDRIRELEALEKRTSETLEGMRDVGTAAAKQQEKWEKQVSELSAAKADLQAALEKAWRELAEARRGAAAQVERQEGVVQDTVAKAVAEHRKEVAEVRAAAEERESALERVVEELRTAVHRAAEEAAAKEEEHAREVRELQRRAAAGEARGEALASHALDSTVPLLRQIEALQQSAIAKSQAWDALERSLRAQCREADVRRTEALEAAARSASQAQDASRRLAEADAELGKRKEELEAARTVAARDAESANSAAAQRDARTKELAAVKAELAITKEELEEIRVRHQQLVSARRLSSPPVAAFASQAVSTSPSPPLSASQRIGGGGGLSASQRALTSSAAAAIPAVERLSALLAQREGEFTAVQGQLSSLKAVKSELEEEVVRLTARTSDLQVQIDSMSRNTVACADLERRHGAALVLLGEQEERVQELLLDIEDMKATYRAQLAQLAAENESLKRK